MIRKLFTQSVRLILLVIISVAVASAGQSPRTPNLMPDAENAVPPQNSAKSAQADCISPWWPVGGFVAPGQWVRSGEEVIHSGLEITNNCEQEYVIDSVAAWVTEGPEGAVVGNSGPIVIAPGATEAIDIVINPGGFINPPPGEAVFIEARLPIFSEDPNWPGPGFYQVSTFVADTLVQVMWDTISNGVGQSLTVANNGNAGNSGSGRANLDFVYLDESGPECTEDPTKNVYMYDLTPVIMTGTSDGEYSWQPFHSDDLYEPYYFSPFASDLYPWRRVVDDAEEYFSGVFVTADSSIGCTKFWAIPNDDASFVVEEWKIFAMDGTPHTGVRVGEWIDWDIPSGTDGNEGGYVNSPGIEVDYLYQRGKVNPEADPAPCLSEDRRYGASGLIDYYYTSEVDTGSSWPHYDLFGGGVLLDSDIFDEGPGDFLPDSAWEFLNRGVLTANNSADEDQQIWLSFGQFDINPGDTLVVHIVHASVYDGDEDDLQAVITAAAAWWELRESSMFCGCGNTDCSSDRKSTLSDLTKLLDWWFISEEPLVDPSAANVDFCGDVDLADLVLFMEYARLTGSSSSFCSYTVDCAYAPEGDTVELVVAKAPFAEINDRTMQLDLYVKNCRTLAAAELGFKAVDREIVVDSVIVHPLVDSSFFSIETDVSPFGMSALQMPNHGNGLAPDSATKRLWVSYFLTLSEWSEADSVVFDTASQIGTRDMFKLVRSPYDGSSADSLGYRPVWAGPVVVRDEWYTCCGRYTGGWKGNVDCDPEGKWTLADITRLIDIVYISRGTPCCLENANMNGDAEKKLTLSDITALIDAIYISKCWYPACTPPDQAAIPYGCH